uniref:Uncharacterized protein n=2 Tax=Caenorhabditis tropicalis TaxID=1561998 RepID=A0A1I7V2E8_9PELO
MATEERAPESIKNSDQETWPMERTRLLLTIDELRETARKYDEKRQLEAQAWKAARRREEEKARAIRVESRCDRKAVEAPSKSPRSVGTVQSVPARTKWPKRQRKHQDIACFYCRQSGHAGRQSGPIVTCSQRQQVGWLFSESAGGANSVCRRHIRCKGKHHFSVCQDGAVRRQAEPPNRGVLEGQEAREIENDGQEETNKEDSEDEEGDPEHPLDDLSVCDGSPVVQNDGVSVEQEKMVVDMVAENEEMGHEAEKVETNSSSM